MAQRKRHSGSYSSRRRLSDGGPDWVEIALGAAAGVGGYYLLESVGILGGSSSQPQKVGTQINVLPNNPLAYVAAIPLSMLLWALFIP